MQKEYGKKKGTQVFYAWEHKHKNLVVAPITLKDMMKRNSPSWYDNQTAIDLMVKGVWN